MKISFGTSRSLPLRYSALARRALLSVIVLIAFLSTGSPSFSQEEIQYKRFNLEEVTCDVGILYRQTPQGMEIGVSAIATGRGAEFRKWKVKDIWLSLDDGKTRPARTDKFYVTKESLFRLPAAVVFVAIGAFDKGPDGSQLSQGVTRAGMALGMGLLVLQAQGDIAGERCIFKVDQGQMDRMRDGADALEVTVEHPDLHLSETIRIGVAKLPLKEEKRYDFSRMSQDDLVKMVDTLGQEVEALERERKEFRYGVDPEYDTVQRKIEGLQTERGLAYKTWFEREQDRRSSKSAP